jgi:anti-anti-sigma factor
MIISSRTPEGLPNRCPVCDDEFRLDPSSATGDVPCPSCGTLVWFANMLPGRDVRVVRFLPEDMIDQSSVETTARRLNKLVLSGESALIFDLSDITFLSDGATEMLLEIKEQIDSSSGRLCLCSVHAHVHEVFRVARISKRFAFYEDLRQALSSF